MKIGRSMDTIHFSLVRALQTPELLPGFANSPSFVPAGAAGIREATKEGKEH